MESVMENKTVRVTKANRYADIKVLLTGEGEVKFGTTIEDAVAFIDHEVNLLAKKNANGDKKQTEAQKKNDGYMAEIVDFLAGIEGDGMTCTDIGKAIPSLAAFNTSKMSSLCNALVKRGDVVKATVKGKTLFKLA